MTPLASATRPRTGRLGTRATRRHRRRRSENANLATAPPATTARSRSPPTSPAIEPSVPGRPHGRAARRRHRSGPRRARPIPAHSPIPVPRPRPHTHPPPRCAPPASASPAGVGEYGVHERSPVQVEPMPRHPRHGRQLGVLEVAEEPAKPRRAEQRTDATLGAAIPRDEAASDQGPAGEQIGYPLRGFREPVERRLSRESDRKTRRPQPPPDPLAGLPHPTSRLIASADNAFLAMKPATGARSTRSP